MIYHCGFDLYFPNKLVFLFIFPLAIYLYSLCKYLFESFCFSFCFWDRGSCSPGWPWTCCVVEAPTGSSCHHFPRAGIVGVHPTPNSIGIFCLLFNSCLGGGCVVKMSFSLPSATGGLRVSAPIPTAWVSLFLPWLRGLWVSCDPTCLLCFCHPCFWCRSSENLANLVTSGSLLGVSSCSAVSDLLWRFPPF